MGVGDHRYVSVWWWRQSCLTYYDDRCTQDRYISHSLLWRRRERTCMPVKNESNARYVIVFISWVFLMHASALTKTGFVVNKFICCSTGLLECRIELQYAAPNCGRWSGPSSTPARQRLVATEVSQWVAFAPSSFLHWIDGVLLLDDAWIIRSALVCGRFNSMLISFKKATDGDLVSSSE